MQPHTSFADLHVLEVQQRLPEEPPLQPFEGVVHGHVHKHPQRGQCAEKVKPPELLQVFLLLTDKSQSRKKELS
jgi:hypothetical protein